jgi:hypothetical protein
MGFSNQSFLPQSRSPERLRRLMCGGGYAPPRKRVQAFWGYAPNFLGRSPISGTAYGRSETFRTSGGKAAFIH